MPVVFFCVQLNKNVVEDRWALDYHNYIIIAYNNYGLKYVHKLMDHFHSVNKSYPLVGRCILQSVDSGALNQYLVTNGKIEVLAFSWHSDLHPTTTQWFTITYFSSKSWFSAPQSIDCNMCLPTNRCCLINSLGPIRFFHIIIAYIASWCNQRY